LAGQLGVLKKEAIVTGGGEGSAQEGRITRERESTIDNLHPGRGKGNGFISSKALGKWSPVFPRKRKGEGHYPLCFLGLFSKEFFPGKKKKSFHLHQREDKTPLNQLRKARFTYNPLPQRGGNSPGRASRGEVNLSAKEKKGKPKPRPAQNRTSIARGREEDGDFNVGSWEERAAGICKAAAPRRKKSPLFDTIGAARRSGARSSVRKKEREGGRSFWKENPRSSKRKGRGECPATTGWSVRKEAIFPEGRKKKLSSFQKLTGRRIEKHSGVSISKLKEGGKRVSYRRGLEANE